MRALRVTLVTVGVFQLALGALFLVAPGASVSTAAFAPALFIGALLWFHPRRLQSER
ncbi:hypothetical protein P3T36_000568 [Kitasatospora sp. MAP12-15]|uniref:hypothetical protein n=1 Tax=unclassified Kitasatospora TaxID=2633591 RepID=UPI002476AA36|nr:hypothetical protein [Kitasatospora sp. MAP12-44]MDH6114167.1 hypothetical protein [Kitasatospora sp. MAP12-44]